MHAQFWHNAWDNGKTGWKQRSVNAQLREHWPELGLSAGAKVFVPLCGDSKDMLWLLEQGYEVVGSELSEEAVRQFFAEHFGQEITPDPAPGITQDLDGPDQQTSKSVQAGHTVYQADGIRIYCGDFFALSAARLGDVDAAYDRAATVAMSPELRPAYASKMQELINPGGSVMLIAFEYEQEKMAGPPFSVPREQIEKMYAENFDITMLSTKSGPEHRGNLAERGLDTLTETVYRMVRQQTL